MNILMTGGTGFIGKYFISAFGNKYKIICPSLRSNGLEKIDFSNISCVLHLAAKVHDMKVSVSNAYNEVNYNLTKQLADKAKQQGVSHFIFVSSVKVYGDDINGILNEQAPCEADDDYGRSKWKAEQYLQCLANHSFRVAILRLPMVYGPEGKGNMEKLIALCTKGYPLPFANICNCRTMVYIENLGVYIDAVIVQNATGIFIPSDPECISTTEMVRTIQESLFNKAKMFAIPSLMRFLLKRFKPATYKRLFGSFEFDNTSTLHTLKLRPPYTTRQGLQKTVAAFKTSTTI